MSGPGPEFPARHFEVERLRGAVLFRAHIYVA